MRRPILFAVTTAALTLPLAAAPKPPPTQGGREAIYFTITLTNATETRAPGRALVGRSDGFVQQIQGANLGGWAKADGLDVTWDVPESRSTAGPLVGGVRVASGDVNDSGSPGRITGVAADPPDPNARGHSMLGASDRVTVGGSQTEAQATGKRQHMPLRARAYYDTPQGTGPGVLKVKARFPGCTVGARYAGMQFAGGGQTYRLRDVRVASCGTSANTHELQEVTFVYRRID